MTEKIHISSLVLQLRPERLDAVSRRCADFGNVEIHAADERGRLVLVLETTGQREIVETIDRLRDEEGVLAVNMVYHHAESARELDQEMTDETDAT